MKPGDIEVMDSMLDPVDPDREYPVDHIHAERQNGPGWEYRVKWTVRHLFQG